MKKCLYLLLLLPLGLFAQEQSSTLDSIDQLWIQLEQSLVQVEQMLNYTELELNLVKNELKISKELLIEVSKLSEDRLEQYNKLETKYNQLLKRLNLLERNSKVKNWVITIESIGIFILFLALFM